MLDKVSHGIIYGRRRKTRKWDEYLSLLHRSLSPSLCISIRNLKCSPEEAQDARSEDAPNIQVVPKYFSHHEFQPICINARITERIFGKPYCIEAPCAGRILWRALGLKYVSGTDSVQVFIRRREEGKGKLKTHQRPKTAFNIVRSEENRYWE